MNRSKPFVVYWNNIPSPYMVERFNALADREKFEFEAWFNDRIEADRSWNVDESSWRFRYRYMPSNRLFGRIFHWPTPIFGRRPDVLVSLYAEPSFIIGWLLAKVRGARTAFWCQVTMDRWVQRREWKNIIKRLMFKRVDATLGSGEDSRKFAMKYGTPAGKAMCLRHSIDVQHYMGLSKSYGQAELTELRSSLGLRGTTFIYVGRLWWGKGLNYLLDAFQKVQNEISVEVSLLLVGDGSEEKSLRKQCEDQGIRNVSFAGFMQKPDLPKYYAVSDVFVFPTLGDPYGLVVDEAMACSLPIISSSSAGEILERVEEGVNGYIVPPEDSTALADRMQVLALNSDLRALMGRSSASKIEEHTPEKWTKDFVKIIDKILNA